MATKKCSFLKVYGREDNIVFNQSKTDILSQYNQLRILFYFYFSSISLQFLSISVLSQCDIDPACTHYLKITAEVSFSFGEYLSKCPSHLYEMRIDCFSN